MPTPSPALLQANRTETGYVVQIIGRGTMQVSPSLNEFATACLVEERCFLVVDLRQCEHLDSTFLGCLVNLHRQFNPSDSLPNRAEPRFAVAGHLTDSQRLLSPTRLDKLLHLQDPPTTLTGTWIPLPCPTHEGTQLGHHILECHRRLAEIEGPHQEAFARIVKHLAEELESR